MCWKTVFGGVFICTVGIKINVVSPGEFSYSEQTQFLSVLSSLAVRNEYCQAVVDQGMLKAILDLLSKEGQDRNIIKESLKLLKVLAGNDNVKQEIASLNGFAPVLNSILNNLVRARYKILTK